MRDLWRFSIGGSLFLFCWTLGAIFPDLGAYGFLLGIGIAYFWLAMVQSFRVPKFYWEKIYDSRFQIVIALLIISHAIPSWLVFAIFPAYALLFVGVAAAHVLGEAVLMLTRKPKDPNEKKKIRLSFRKSTYKKKRVFRDGYTLIPGVN